LKLYFPSDSKQVALHELVDYSSKAVLARSEAVYCGHCDAKTTHTLSRDSDPDLFAVELIRVIDSNGWIKNDSMVTFPVTGLALPGFPRRYRVVATCDHRGSLNGGHWLTKVSTSRGWFELDDLSSRNFATDPPGVNDKSVVLILLIAEDRLL